MVIGAPHAEPDDATFREVYEYAPFGYFSVGADGLIRQVNRYACDLLGFDARDLVGRPVLSLYARAATGRAHAEELFRRFLLGEEIRQEALEMRKADGAPLWVSLTVRPVRDAGGLIASHSIIADLSSQKRTEDALQASRTHLEAILDLIPVGVVEVDAAQRITMFNRTAEAIFDYAADEVLQAQLSLLLPERFRTAHRTLVDDFASGPPTVRRMADRGRVYGRRKCGEEFPAEASIAKVELDDRTTCLVALRDVSEQCRQDVERQRLQEQILQAQKLDAIGQLAGGVAHDFNNLLTVMVGAVDFALDEQHPRSADLLEARHAIDRAGTLTRQLLAFSRKQLLEPALVDLNDAVTDMSRMLRRLIEEHVEIVTDLQPSLPRVVVDPAQIEQVILNLAINARDAMPDGGTLAIQTAAVELDDKDARVQGGVPSGRYVMLSVRDTGTGMDAGTLERIFEPFFTTKNRGKGSGLGLATAYDTIKQSGGHIQVESEPGRGATFRIYLPLGLEGRAGVAAHEPAERSAARGAETILVAEDDAAVRAFACHTLERLGYTVLEANDAEGARGLADRHDGPIHLLLTDVLMPKMNGRELSRHIAARRPRIKTLFMSGYAGHVLARAELSDPDVALLEKPFTPTALARRVRQALDAGR